MPTDPCRHAHGEILLCSRCLMGRADALDPKGAAITPLEGPKPVAQPPEKPTIPDAAKRNRRPFEGVARKSGRPSKIQKARLALQGILKRDAAKAP